MKKTLLIVGIAFMQMFASAQPADFQGLDESSNSIATLFGEVQFNGVPAETGDWIAAFDEQNNLVGTYEILSGFMVMKTYGGDNQLVAGEMFTLRGWDADGSGGTGEYYSTGEPEDMFGPWSPQLGSGYLPGFGTGQPGGNFIINFGNSLPIELKSFQINKLSCNAYQVNWTTSSEINNDYFTVERSIDDTKKFEAFIKIDGAGTSSSEERYSYTDEIQLVGSHEIYYRLKQTDFDGKFTYSDIIVEKYRCDDIRTLAIYPNPFHSNIQMSNIGDTNNTVRVTNNLGQVTYQATLNQNTINTDQWQSGVYYIHEISNGNIISSQKLIKQE